MPDIRGAWSDVSDHEISCEVEACEGHVFGGRARCHGLVATQPLINFQRKVGPKEGQRLAIVFAEGVHGNFLKAIVEDADALCQFKERPPRFWHRIAPKLRMSPGAAAIAWA